MKKQRVETRPTGALRAVMLRIPETVARRLERDARAAGRSMNAEITIRLIQSIVESPELDTMEQRLAKLEQQYEEREERLNERLQNLARMEGMLEKFIELNKSTSGGDQ
jgi:hypothetical protein